jgi:hypothetical protein
MAIGEMELSTRDDLMAFEVDPGLPDEPCRGAGLYVTSLKEFTPYRVTPDDQCGVNGFDWSADGSSIVYSLTEDHGQYYGYCICVNNLFGFNVASAVTTRLTSFDPCGTPCNYVGPYDPVIAQDGSVAVGVNPLDGGMLLLDPSYQIEKSLTIYGKKDIGGWSGDSQYVAVISRQSGKDNLLVTGQQGDPGPFLATSDGILTSRRMWNPNSAQFAAQFLFWDSNSGKFHTSIRVTDSTGADQTSVNLPDSVGGYFGPIWAGDRATSAPTPTHSQPNTPTPTGTGQRETRDIGQPRGRSLTLEIHKDMLR